MDQPSIYEDPLLNRLRYALTKRDMMSLARAYLGAGYEPQTFVSLSQHPNPAVAFHAAWVLEGMLFSAPGQLDAHLLTLIDCLPRSSHQSAQRHIAKLIAEGLRRVTARRVDRALERRLWGSDLEPLEEVCFALLAGDRVRPGVKVHCMEILFHLSQRQRWIA